MTLLREFHQNWALLVIALNLVAAIWGLLAAWRDWTLPRFFWWLIVAAQVAVVPQLIAGIILWSSGARPVSGWQHLIYGAAALFGITIGLVYRSRMRQRPALLYGLVSLFIFFAVFRGFLTGLG
jgi:hypothetical protein